MWNPFKPSPSVAAKVLLERRRLLGRRSVAERTALLRAELGLPPVSLR
jgi:hypothetical protein